MVYGAWVRAAVDKRPLRLGFMASNGQRQTLEQNETNEGLSVPDTWEQLPRDEDPAMDKFAQLRSMVMARCVYTCRPRRLSCGEGGPVCDSESRISSSIS